MSTSPDARHESSDHTADSGQLEVPPADADTTAAEADTHTAQAPETSDRDETLTEPEQPDARHDIAETADEADPARSAAEQDTTQKLGHHALAQPADAAEADTDDDGEDGETETAKGIGRAATEAATNSGDDKADTTGGVVTAGGDKKGDNETTRVTIPVAQLKLSLDKLAVYGARAMEDDVSPQVNIAAMQARLDAAEAVEAESLAVDASDLAALQRIEPQPSQLDKLHFLDNRDESRQPVADRIVAERALSLLAVTQRDILMRSLPMGGSQDTETIAADTGKNLMNVQHIRWQAQREYTRLSDEIERGELDLDRHRDEHPKSRSPLTLLRGLGQTIEPDARMSTLREQGLAALNQTGLNSEQKVAMAHLYGLYPDRHPMSTTEVAKAVGLQRATSIVNMERVMYGEQSPNYHPERQMRRKA